MNRKPPIWLPTLFYPQYEKARRDYVSPVKRIVRTEFQVVIPYYELSQSDTQDDGTGSFFEQSNDLRHTRPPAFVLRKKTQPHLKLLNLKRQKKTIRPKFVI